MAGIGVFDHHAEIIAADLEAMTRAQHFSGDDRHQVEDQEDRAGNHRGPQQAAAVFPIFALQEPVEGFHA